MFHGPVGAYWNPASLGRSESPSGVQAPLDAHVEITGPVIEGANDLHDASKACQSTPHGSHCTQTNINAALNKLNSPQSGMRGDVALGAYTKAAD